jgi:hypothetical protein
MRTTTAVVASPDRSETRLPMRETTQTKNLRSGRDEAVQNHGCCGLKPELFELVSQFANKK